MAHIVILGAGASRAAFPNGDRAGRRLPVMADLVQLLDLRSVLETYGVDAADAGNFEELYSKLYAGDPTAPVIRAIEERVRRYFASLQLPETATIYDRLVLSLQPRDLIATFNWDPFLFLAYRRNLRVRRLPKLAALHGSVAVGVCEKHKSCGYADAACPECEEGYAPVRLLYPVREKNYQAHSFIAEEWERLRAHLAQGYWVTFFGYGAPATDVEAVGLLHEMFEANRIRDYGNVEIIDIRDPEELRKQWDRFFVRSHYSIHSDFSESILSRNPRRSAETLWRQTMLLQPVAPQPFPRTDDLGALQEAATKLAEEET